MLNPRIAAPYAKSLLDIAIEQGQLETVYADMQFLGAAINSNRDFLNLLRSPIVKGETKNKIVSAVTEGRVSPLTAAFNKLLISKGRETYMPEIIAAFVKQYKAHKNIHVVKLTTATPVSNELKSTIIDQLRKTTHMQNIELEEKVDAALIGGFTLQAGDKLVDASIAYDLNKIAKQFQNNDFVYQVR
ncbi:MAG: ATP synthase F1 subunit delta [Chitinophagaceae bacterium]